MDPIVDYNIHDYRPIYNVPIADAIIGLNNKDTVLIHSQY